MLLSGMRALWVLVFALALLSPVWLDAQNRAAERTPAARGETPAAFGWRCIPAGGVAPRSNTPGILTRPPSFAAIVPRELRRGLAEALAEAGRALPPGRIATLGATLGLYHGLLDAAVAPIARPGVAASDECAAECDAYLALLGRYEAGDYRGAATVAARLDVDTARRLARLVLDDIDRSMVLVKRLKAESTEAPTRSLLNQLRRERVRRLKLTLLVHTEAAVRVRDVKAFAGQLTLAREAVGRLRDLEEELTVNGPLNTSERERGVLRSDEPQPSHVQRPVLGRQEWEAIRLFIRDWYLVVASRLQLWDHLAFLKRHVREGLELFRDEPALLLARGTISEAEADRAIIDRSLTREIYASDYVHRWRQFMSAAGGDYQAATGRQPDLYEATLRWGRICAHLGDRKEARRALDEVAASDGPAHLRYLAHLFLGELAEREQQPDRARAAYESALALFPTAQAPMLALSLLCDSAGESECARRWLSQSLAATGRGRLDPWWAYQRGQAWLGDTRLAAFRARGLQK